VLPTGPLNAITDVAGVKFGQVTIVEGSDIRTGVTAILPHGGNLYQDKVPAGFAVGNAYGKFMGSTQIKELGEIETPILLTNTLNVPEAAAGTIEWTLKQPGNQDVRSVNAIVGETNEGILNDIRARRVRPADADDRLQLEGRDRNEFAQASGEPRRMDGRRAGSDELRRGASGRWRADRAGARPILSEG
jgi:D-aminopeptidase